MALNTQEDRQEEYQNLNSGQNETARALFEVNPDTIDLQNPAVERILKNACGDTYDKVKDVMIAKVGVFEKVLAKKKEVSKSPQDAFAAAFDAVYSSVLAVENDKEVVGALRNSKILADEVEMQNAHPSIQAIARRLTLLAQANKVNGGLREDGKKLKTVNGLIVLMGQLEGMQSRFSVVTVDPADVGLAAKLVDDILEQMAKLSDEDIPGALGHHARISTAWKPGVRHLAPDFIRQLLDLQNSGFLDDLSDFAGVLGSAGQASGAEAIDIDKLVQDALMPPKSAAEVEKLKRELGAAEADVTFTSDAHKLLAPDSLEAMQASLAELELEWSKNNGEGILPAGNVNARLRQLEIDKKGYEQGIQQAVANKDPHQSLSAKLTIVEAKLAYLRRLKEKSEALYVSFSKVHSALKKAGEKGVSVSSTVQKLSSSTNPSSSDFSPISLVTSFNSFKKQYLDDTKDILSGLDVLANKSSDTAEAKKKELELAKTAYSEAKSITPGKAAQKIMAAIVAKQYPDYSADRQARIARIALAEDMGVMKSADGRELRGSREKLNTLTAAGFSKLIALKYEEDGKVHEPFKGMKPEDFMNDEKLLQIVNLENGFMILAAFKMFSGTDGSDQIDFLEDRLKILLLADGLGLDPVIDEDKILDKLAIPAVRDELDNELEIRLERKGTSYIKAFSEHHDELEPKRKVAARKKRDEAYKLLLEQKRLGEVDDKEFEEQRAEIAKQAADDGIEELADDTILSGFATSPVANWLDDLGHNIGDLAQRKVGSLAKAANDNVWAAVGGTVGTGFKMGVEATKLALAPVRYPFILAGGVGRKMANFIRKEQKQPISVVAAVKEDVGKVFKVPGRLLSGAKDTAIDAAKTGAKNVKDRWTAEKYTKIKYADRSKFKKSAAEARIKRLAEEAKQEAVVIKFQGKVSDESFKSRLKAAVETAEPKAKTA
jgi:hypothetical protein